MHALDTNVVVRLLVNDDAAQARRARALLASGGPWLVPATVLLECEWVLRGAYGLPSSQIMVLLRALLGLPGVRCSQADATRRAMAACEAGLDFADALHLAGAAGAERFYSFDAALRRRHAKAGIAAPLVTAP